MRKLKNFVAAFAIMAAAVAGTSVTANASDDLTAEYQEVSVSKVDDITDLSNEPESGVVEDLLDITEGGVYTYYYKFTLDKPGYFYMESYARLAASWADADMYVYLGTDKNFDGEPVIETYMDGSDSSYKMAFEAGTYYIKVKCDLDDEPEFVDERVMKIALYTEELTRTGKNLGTTMKKAINMSSSASGILTKTSRNQWFKFKVGQKSDVTLDTVLNWPIEWDYAGVRIMVYDKDGASVSDNYLVSGNPDNSETIKFKGLAKGTYYVAVSGEYEFCEIKQTVSVKDKYKPAAPKITSCKKNRKYVSGKGEAGTKVTVKYNGKSYKGTVKSNGTFKVTVAKLKAGKKVTVTLKDKAGNSSSPKTVKVK